LARDFPSDAVYIPSKSLIPAYSSIPLPVLPITPIPCESSIINTELYLLHNSIISLTGAISPSVEKTDSVITKIYL